MAREIQVGLIGYGMAGRVFHAPTISAVAGLRLAAVVERRGEESRRRYPAVTVVRDAEALLADPAIELVVIATPNLTHAPLARQAMLAGKHVVVDKPFTITSAEADGLIALAKEQGRLLSVFQSRRWDGDFQTVQALLRGGRLGQLAEYEVRYERYRPAPRPNSWREAAQPGSGILYDLGAHLIDQALLLFGMPRQISAQVRRQRAGVQADDYFHLMLDYGDLIATLKASMLSREPGPHFTLHGTAGSFIKHGMDPQEDLLKVGATPGGEGWGHEPPTLWGRLNTAIDGLRYEGAVESLPGRYQGFYENIYAALLGEAALSVTAEQARNTIRIIELAQQSSAEGRAVTVDSGGQF